MDLLIVNDTDSSVGTYILNNGREMKALDNSGAHNYYIVDSNYIALTWGFRGYSAPDSVTYIDRLLLEFADIPCLSFGDISIMRNNYHDIAQTYGCKRIDGGYIYKDISIPDYPIIRVIYDSTVRWKVSHYIDENVLSTLKEELQK